jgi:hypothetical protein
VISPMTAEAQSWAARRRSHTTCASADGPTPGLEDDRFRYVRRAHQDSECLATTPPSLAAGFSMVR